MEKQIHHTFFYSSKPEIVWDYLTKPEFMEQWLMKTTFMPIVGYDFQFVTNPIPKLEFDGIIHCKVLEIDLHKRLSYSWKCGPGDGTITTDSIVEWTLTPKDNGTELVLHHGSFKKIHFDLFNGMVEGWQQNMQKIATLITASK